LAVVLLVFNYIDGDVKSDTLLIFFDEKDIVQDYAFARDTDQLAKWGFWSR
jgi:hypothetical protein